MDWYNILIFILSTPMKTSTTLLLFFISIFCTHAQDREIISEKHLYDFCYCDYIGDSLVMGHNEIHKDVINDNLYQQATVKGSIVFNGKEIMFLRIFHDSTMYIKEEYVKLEADTFHYVRHDNSNKHRVVERGSYYFDRNNMHLDSTHFISFDPDTYDEIKETTIYHLYPKVKHGNWAEKDSTKSMNGSYIHGKRNGYWFFEHFNSFSTTKVTYQNDEIISQEELNLIEKENNLKELENTLTDGCWGWATTNNLKTLQRNQGISFTITFFKNHTYKQKLHYSIKEGTWKISLENKTLTIDDKIHKIDWFSDFLIQFAPKEK